MLNETKKVIEQVEVDAKAALAGKANAEMIIQLLDTIKLARDSFLDLAMTFAIRGSKNGTEACIAAAKGCDKTLGDARKHWEAKS